MITNKPHGGVPRWKHWHEPMHSNTRPERPTTEVKTTAAQLKIQWGNNNNNNIIIIIIIIIGVGVGMAGEPIHERGYEGV